MMSSLFRSNVCTITIIVAFALSCDGEPGADALVHNPEQYSPELSLSERLAQEPPPIVLSYLQELDGDPGYTIRGLTGGERRQALAIIEDFPRGMREILRERLLGIYVVPDFASSAMAEAVWDTENEKIYGWIVINADVFELTATELLNRRVQTVFTDLADVQFEIDPDLDAFEYIMIHECVHIADYATRITPYVDSGSRQYQETFIPDGGGFGVDIWKDYRQPVEGKDFDLRSDITFYGFRDGPKLDPADALAVYQGLADSPFISLYGALSTAEDVAELYSYVEMDRRGHSMRVRVGAGPDATWFEPLDFPGVTARIDEMNDYPALAR